MDTRQLLRTLPKTDELLKRDDLTALDAPRGVVVDSVRAAIDSVREGVLAGEDLTFSDDSIAADAMSRVAERMKASLRPVINATGIIVHTNLGRSRLSAEAIRAVTDVACNYSTLEYDIPSGERGSRHVHVERLICDLTGAEAAMAVNNNAAAVLLAISALAARKESVVSRGQLVEIGGSFRIPDIMRQSGAKMVEVGATNKTHVRDYAAAITPKTGLLLKVHSSNFKVVGFTEEVDLVDLVALGNSRGIPVFEDQGSGVLLDLRPYGLPYEPTVGESIACGAPLVSCSGDKLLGGPQAGILCGSQEIISRLKRHPMARALRLDKMTLAALEVTLRTYLDPERALREIPTLRMITTPVETVRKRAEALASAISVCSQSFDVQVQDSIARAGGGALPLADIPTVVVALLPKEGSVVELERRLRLGTPSVVARIKEDRLMLDPRTLSDDELDIVAKALGRICAECSAGKA